MYRRLFMSLFVLILSACSSVVPSTMLRVNALDPFSADAKDMAVALDLPAGLALQQGATRMMFNATHSPSGETWSAEYTLIEQRTPDGLVIYTLSAQDIADLNAIKRTLLQWKDTSDGNSTLSVDVRSNACRVVDVDIAADPRVSVLLRLEANGPLRPLLRDASVLDFFDVADLPELPHCSGPF